MNEAYGKQIHETMHFRHPPYNNDGADIIQTIEKDLNLGRNSSFKYLNSNSYASYEVKSYC